MSLTNSASRIHLFYSPNKNKNKTTHSRCLIIKTHEPSTGMRERKSKEQKIFHWQAGQQQQKTKSVREARGVHVVSSLNASTTTRLHPSDEGVGRMNA